MKTCKVAAGVVVGLVASLAFGDPTPLAKVGIPDEFRIKREPVFEFASKPTVARDGDNVTISFATRGRCDVTVAIEQGGSGDGPARIVRHLASGVLGAGAPAPFRKDSLDQTITWDGKDDSGNYLARPQDAVVRVSLGLSPRFERTLFWSPHKRLTNGKAIDADALRICARPEGVYVSDGTGVDSVRLFDHDGNYVRTIYPFPGDKLMAVRGLNRIALPQDGLSLPLGDGMMHATMLTCGTSVEPNNKYGFAAQFLAAQGEAIAIGFRKLNRLASEGSSGGLPLEGPGLARDVVIGREDMWSGGKKTLACPRSAAFSPDGKLLYLSGYGWTGVLGRAQEWLSGVTRMEFAGEAMPTLFAGSLRQGDHGTGDGQFKWAVAVAVDAQGRVYVADHLNSRIQVFSPEGRFIKAIAVDRPTFVGVHHETGQIYVLSWRLGSDDPISAPVKSPKYTRLGPLDDPKVLATYPLTVLKEYDLQRGGSSRLLGGGMQYIASLDSWSDTPTIWLGAGKGEPIVMLVEKAGRLEVSRDFARDITSTVVRAVPPIIQRQRLYVNPADGKLFVGEGDSGVMKSFKQIVEIDPESGQVRLVDLPFDAEDMCIDIDGKFYLRTDVVVARYDPRNWREIPWDYGEERKAVSFGGDGRAADLVAGLPLPVTRRPSWWHAGGMAVNAKRHLAVTCYNTTSKAAEFGSGTAPSGNAERDAKRGVKTVYQTRRYVPPLYPGRDPDWQTHIWDKHGKSVVHDATPGLTTTDGIGVDKDDNIYALASPNRMLGDKSYPIATAGTLMKIRPGSARLICGGKDLPVPLEPSARPARPVDVVGAFMRGGAWAEGVDWMYGGVGLNNMACVCWNARPALDLYARSFAPEINHYSVAVLDSNGNLILRIGRYGNVDDGVPLVGEPGRPRPRSIGGDEVSLIFGAYLATHSDRRLFIADPGNSRIVSVRLDYHTEERLPVPKASGADR